MATPEVKSETIAEVTKLQILCWPLTAQMQMQVSPHRPVHNNVQRLCLSEYLQWNHHPIMDH